MVKSLFLVLIFSSVSSFAQVNSKAISKAANILGDAFEGVSVFKLKKGKDVKSLVNEWNKVQGYEDAPVFNATDVASSDGSAMGTTSMKVAYDFLDGFDFDYWNDENANAREIKKNAAIKKAFSMLVGTGVVFVFDEMSTSFCGMMFGEVGLLDTAKKTIYMISLFENTGC
jgi:hypothetical protein